MKAAIYNPYLDTLGGGERYATSFVKVLLNEGYDVDIEWKEPQIKDKLTERFGINISKSRIVNDIKRGDGYDVCFWLSDGSIPTLRSRKNFLHFQFPFKNVGGKSLLNKMKLFRINKIICNSNFTKKFIDREFGVESIVIYPPIDTDAIKPKKKENIILYVGRFSDLTQAKRQDVLIENFKKFFAKGHKKWRLILAGGVEIGAEKILPRLKNIIDGYPIHIVESPAYKDLISFYGRAKIFWSAVGYEFDQQEEPTKVEHFGMSVVEAMSAGAVPILYNAGGYKEIIKDGYNGFLWQKNSDLINKTINIIKEETLMKSLSQNAIDSSTKYGFDKFSDQIRQLL